MKTDGGNQNDVGNDVVLADDGGYINAGLSIYSHRKSES